MGDGLILEYGDPADWRAHRFGLSPERWAALAGQVVWIPGGGTGFGRAIAAALAAASARPVLSGRRPETLQAAVGEIAAFGADPSNVLTEPCDITDEAQVVATVARILTHAGRLDALAACAALPMAGAGPTPLADLPLERWRALIDTNVTAQWLAARAALPAMLAGNAARIVFLTSEAGWAFTPGFGPYNLTKAALNNLGASLAAETAAAHPQADVQINVLNPGEARTEMNQGSEVSPYAAVAMTLTLLSHPAGGPNGRFFARDGRHLGFAYAEPWPTPLA